MKKNLAIILIAAILFFALGMFAGAKFGGQSFLKAFSGNNNYQAGWEAAQKRFLDFSQISGNVAGAVNSIQGEVKEIKDGKVVIKIKPLELLASQDLDERVVVIDASTKIFLLEMKDPADYQKTVEDYNKKMKEASASLKPGDTISPASVPPGVFDEKPIKLSDIKVGYLITVIAVEKDIKNIKEFKASKISVQSSTRCGDTPCRVLDSEIEHPE